MAKCNTEGCNNPAANDCDYSECGAFAARAVLGTSHDARVARSG